MITKKFTMPKALAYALLALCSMPALALDEVEPNTPVTSAQLLIFGPDNSVTVNGVIGMAGGGQQLDADLYTFEGREGDLVTIDIDGAWTENLFGLDANIALFGPFGDDPYHILDQVDQSSIDPGSIDVFDPRIDAYRLPVTGTYVVGVSGAPATFVDVNTLSTSVLELNSNGAYTLIVSRVPAPAPAPAALPVNIEIKPGSTDVPALNPKAKGTIPVALLSSSDFDALQVDFETLRFGATGNEESLVRCNKDGTDVNGDGRLDLVCHFDNRKAGFQVGDTEGTVKGTKGGTAFKGTGWLKVVAGKRRR